MNAGERAQSAERSPATPPVEPRLIPLRREQTDRERRAYALVRAARGIHADPNTRPGTENYRAVDALLDYAEQELTPDG